MEAIFSETCTDLLCYKIYRVVVCKRQLLLLRWDCCEVVVWRLQCCARELVQKTYMVWIIKKAYFQETFCNTCIQYLKMNLRPPIPIFSVISTSFKWASYYMWSTRICNGKLPRATVHRIKPNEVESYRATYPWCCFLCSILYLSVNKSFRYRLHIIYRSPQKQPRQTLSGVFFCVRMPPYGLLVFLSFFVHQIWECEYSTHVVHNHRVLC